MAKQVSKTRLRKAIVVAFGRFQPPTSGHQLLINTVEQYGAKHGIDHAMFSSRSHDSEKNPLTTSKKFYWLKRFFPKANFINDKKILNPVNMLEYLASIGYTDVVMMGGEDRAVMYTGFKRLIKSTKNKNGLALNSINFVQAGVRRDPNAKGVEGMSGTKLREAVRQNKKSLFVKGLPSTASKVDRESFFADFRKGMGLKENYDGIFKSAALRLSESDKYKRRAKTPGQTGGFSKHSTKFPIPPCKIDERIDRWLIKRWNLGNS